jgi:hypothetical protein
MTSRPLSVDPGLLSRRLFTREEFERAGELGLFRPDERLELIEGGVHAPGHPIAVVDLLPYAAA